MHRPTWSAWYPAAGLRASPAGSAPGLPLHPGENLALDPRDTLTLDAPPAYTGTREVPAETLPLFGALLRCGQMTGALERLLDQTASYANERIQFGRTIGSFQIIQQELARLAGQVAEATTATEIAFGAAQRDSTDPTFEIACAKVVVGDAAEIGPRIAHQIHGAIGFTYEHSLHFATRRLWSWRTEFGTPEKWAQTISSVVLDEHAGEIWPVVTSR